MLELVVSLMLSAQAPAQALAKVSGIVRDEAGRPAAAARVERLGGPEVAETDGEGRFSLVVPEGNVTLRASRLRHGAGPTICAPVLHALVVQGPVAGLELVVPEVVRLDETVVVEAVRAADWVPVTTEDLSKDDLARLDRGQELPFLLKHGPSVTQYADNGSEAGYAYLYLRGIPQTRLNLTLDGVPLTDAEDNAFYSVNLGGLTGVLESIQVQRGAATSSFGGASFGGSISLAGLQPEDRAGGRVLVGLGSLGAARGAAEGHSGRFGPGVAAFARAAYQETDGYRDHSGVQQRSLALGLTRQGARSFFKLFGLAGREQQQLAFLAVDEETLAASPRENPLSPAERDRFEQQVLSAHLSHAAGDRTRLTAQAYTNGASGWYRLYADAERSSLYEYALDWRSLGGVVTLSHSRGRFDFTGGAQGQAFESTHSRQTLDVGPDYRNQGDKDEGSAFAKAGFAAGRASAWAEAQVRYARFGYAGDLDLGSVSWTFFNPRLGARLALGTPLSLYASVARTSREPARSDLFAGQDNPTLPYDLGAVRPERAVDVEVGADWSGPRLSLQANVFFMEFRDEIAQTGELSEIGLPLRRNVDRSYRRGLEVQASFRATSELRFRGCLAAMRSRIRSWTQVLDVYDDQGAYLSSEPRVFADVPALLSPAFLANATAEYAKGGLSLSATGRYVSQAHLDNTGSSTSRTPGFFDADLAARYRLKRARAGRGAATLRLDVGNLFDRRDRWPSGYSYLFLTRGPSGPDQPGGVNYFYPLAGRTILVGLELGL